MKITDRYASATRSSCLTVDERTTFSDTDVLGAMGLAAKAFPLAVLLQRLFLGDNGASKLIVGKLELMAWHRARPLRVKLTLQEARGMAQQCLHWHRDSACKACGGHGKLVIEGSTTLGEFTCNVCHGTAKVPFESQFKVEWRELAKWLVGEMEREQSQAGPEAMKRLAPRLSL